MKIKNFKKYIIIKLNDGYAITTNESIEDFYKTGILPYETKYRYKKYLLERIKKDTKYKNNTETKTYYIY